MNIIMKTITTMEDTKAILNVSLIHLIIFSLMYISNTLKTQTRKIVTNRTINNIGNLRCKTPPIMYPYRGPDVLQPGKSGSGKTHLFKSKFTLKYFSSCKKFNISSPLNHPLFSNPFPAYFYICL